MFEQCGGGWGIICAIWAGLLQQNKRESGFQGIHDMLMSNKNHCSRLDSNRTWAANPRLFSSTWRISEQSNLSEEWQIRADMRCGWKKERKAFPQIKLMPWRFQPREESCLLSRKFSVHPQLCPWPKTALKTVLFPEHIKTIYSTLYETGLGDRTLMNQHIFQTNSNSQIHFWHFRWSSASVDVA